MSARFRFSSVFHPDNINLEEPTKGPAGARKSRMCAILPPEKVQLLFFRKSTLDIRISSYLPYSLCRLLFFNRDHERSIRMSVSPILPQFSILLSGIERFAFCFSEVPVSRTGCGLPLFSRVGER